MKRLSWGRVSVIGALVLVVIIIAAGRMRDRSNESDASEAPLSEAIGVRTIDVNTSSIPKWLEATGTIHAELESDLAAKVMGRVISVSAQEGDHVKRGQSLISLDSRDLEASVAQAAANVQSANVGYQNAQVTASMEGSLSEARIAQANARVLQADAALKASQARLELVQAGPRKQERAQADLTVAQAKSSLSLAESTYNRMQNLYGSGAISKQQYDNTKNQYELAKAQYEAALQVQSMTNEGSRAEDIRSAQEAVRQARAETVAARAGVKEAKAAALQTKVRKQQIAGAQAQIGQARANLQLASVTQSYAVIPAPFDGVIAQRMADPGAMASPGVPLLKIQGGVLRLEAIVPESVLAKVVLGQRVSVILDALPNSNIIGRVAEISPKGDSTSHTFIVKINLPAEAGVRAGMFGRARFRIGQEPGLLVPSTAVWEREGLNYIFVISAGKAQLRLVTIGESSGSFIPILSGLTSGERVVISNRERLTDGSSVTDDRR